MLALHEGALRADLMRYYGLSLDAAGCNAFQKIRYGIPIRRSAAIHSIDEEDPRDSIFFSEMARIAPDCTLAWPELYRMVFRCADRMWEEQLDPAEVLPELAAAMRVFIRYNTPRAAAQKEGECHVEHR